MHEQYHAVYQSGQQVLVNGWYEAVATKVPTVSELEVGTTFPNHDGRAICWHLLHSEPYISKRVNLESPKPSVENVPAYSEMYA